MAVRELREEEETRRRGETVWCGVVWPGPAGIIQPAELRQLTGCLSLGQTLRDTEKHGQEEDQYCAHLGRAK